MSMKTKIRSIKIPLNYAGNKKNMIKIINEILDIKNEKQQYEANNMRFIDVFGGSGVLSRFVKDKYPTCEVIYNDYDNYHVQCKNIQQYKDLHTNITTMMKQLNITIEKHKRVYDYTQNYTEEDKANRIALNNYIIESIRDLKEPNTQLLSTWFGFRGATYRESTIYYNMPKTFTCVNDYFEGLNIIREDYKKIFELYPITDSKNFYILDPPYNNTSTEHYRNLMFNFCDSLNVLTESLKNFNNIILLSCNISEQYECVKLLNETYHDNKYNIKQSTIVRSSIGNGIIENCIYTASDLNEN